MDTPRRWIGYDTIKLIVALILLIILILLLRWTSPAVTPIAALSATLTMPAASSELTTSATGPTLTVTPLPLPDATVAPTATLQPTPAPTAAPTATPQPTPTPAPTTAPAATLQPTPAPTVVDCPLAMHSRLKVGMQVRVTIDLNLRSSPGITADNQIHTNPVDTKLEIIGGPVCQPFDNGAYLWWNVKQSDGTAGWSAEGYLNGGFYLLEPVP